MPAEQSRSRLAVAVSLGLSTLATAAYAQSEAGLSRNTYVVGGLILVVVLAILIRSARGKPAPGKAAAPAPAAAPTAEEPPAEAAPTVKSTMGLMSTESEGPLADAYFEIKMTGLTIGRDPSTCDVVHPSEKVSRQHARLDYYVSGLTLKNLSETNQTFLNDEAIDEAIVRSGDRIRIEDVTFKVFPHEGAARDS